MSEENISSGQEIQKMSFGTKFINLFNSQTALFENIKVYPDWLVPVFIMIVVTIITIISTTDLQIEMQKEFIDNSEMIPEERKNDMLDNLENQGIVKAKVVPAIGGAVTIFLSYAIIAGAFLLFGNFIYGGQASFKQMFSLTSWGSLIGLVEMAVKLPLILSKGTLKVFTSLAVFMETSESKTVIFKVLDAFNIFSIWKIIVFSIGFSIIYKMSRGKSYAAIITLYVIYIAIAIGFSQLFKGFTS